MGPCQRGLLGSKQDGVGSEPMCSWMVQQKGAEVRVRGRELSERGICALCLFHAQQSVPPQGGMPSFEGKNLKAGNIRKTYGLSKDASF